MGPTSVFEELSCVKIYSVFVKKSKAMVCRDFMTAKKYSHFIGTENPR
jgi:hypothetical protein